MAVTPQALGQTFEELVCRAARHLSPDIVRALERAAEREQDPGAREVLQTILDKEHDAKVRGRGLSTDLGLVTFFVRAGCTFPGLEDLQAAMTAAVQAATRHEPLAPHSADVATGMPLPENIGRHLPVVHVEVVPDSSDCHVTVLLKGAASESLSALWILSPTTTMEEIGDRLASHLAETGRRFCPPFLVGVGIGGTPEVATMLARKALLRPAGEPSSEEMLRPHETAWQRALDSIGLGPMGVGGTTTVLAVHADCADRHQAFLPVAVSVGCWSDRRASVTVDKAGGVHW